MLRKLQIPSSREVPSPKPQRAALDSHDIGRAVVWSLRFEASLGLGVWGLVLWRAPDSTEANLAGFERAAGRVRNVAARADVRIYFMLELLGYRDLLAATAHEFLTIHPATSLRPYRRSIRRFLNSNSMCSIEKPAQKSLGFVSRRNRLAGAL
jgi:hypothetical protein